MAYSTRLAFLFLLLLFLPVLPTMAGIETPSINAEEDRGLVCFDSTQVTVQIISEPLPSDDEARQALRSSKSKVLLDSITPTAPAARNTKPAQ